MPSFLASEIEKANTKFISLVKKHPCLWNRDATNYNQKPETDMAWEEIAEEMGDTPKTCLIHWQKIRRAYTRSLRINANGTYQKSEYYMSKSLEFLRPHLKLECGPGESSSSSITVVIDTDDSQTSKDIEIKEEPVDSDIEIKDEPVDSDEDSVASENAEKILFEIIEMEDDDGEEENEQSDEKPTKSPSSKRERSIDSNECNQNKVQEENKSEHPNSSLIDANRKFFESLIPFIDDMNTQQNRRFRREIMCLIDDVLDDRDINKENNSS